MLKTIYLHGILAEKFGSKFELDVFSPLEAVKALCYMIDGFRKEFERYGYHVVKGELDTGWDLDESNVSVGIGGFNEVHFIPVVDGSKNVGKALKKFAKVILGVVLIAAAFINPAGLGALSSANFFTSLGFVNGAQLAVTGTLLLIGGIAQATAKTNGVSQSSSSEDTKTSYSFGGAQNVASQGGPIPVVYGRMRVGSQVVSASLTNSNI